MVKSSHVFFKKLIDIIGSSAGIIVLSPFFLLISMAIKLTSGGPVLFKQKRLGKNGKEFEIFKFRTMITGAEKLGDGLTIKSETDSRITKIGKILRKTSLDELPQLINVLRGDMSLVGPRPPVAYFPYDGYENYPDWAKKRFQMKPGVTGLAQVTVRNSVTWDERIKVDNEYIKNFSIFLDIKIIIRTIGKIFKSDSIY